MLNKIYNIRQHKLKFPIFGLLVTCGILGLGIIGQQTKIKLESTAIAANLPASTNQIQGKNKKSLLSRLRDIKAQRSQRNQSHLNNLVTLELPSELLIRYIQKIPTTTRQLTEASPFNFPEKDGIYLYGQSSTPNQLGQGYIVFQKQQGQVIGALYMPHSEFSCFQGTIAKSGQLAMTVSSSPGELGVTQVSANSRIPRLTDENVISYAHSVTLKDYHQLNSVSVNDRQILQACSQNFNSTGK